MKKIIILLLILIPLSVFSQSNDTARTITIQVTALLEGHYNPTTNRMIPDTVGVELWGIGDNGDVLSYAYTILDSMGRGEFVFPNFVPPLITVQPPSYYNYWHRISVFHPNHHQIWAHQNAWFYLSPGVDTISWDFTALWSSHHKCEQKVIGGRSCMPAGDVNGTLHVTQADKDIVQTDADNFVTGYVVTDLNGDGIVDSSDLAIVDENAFQQYFSIRPF